MASNWRHTREYRIWRAQVIRRDKRCRICNSIKNRQAHHLFSGAYYPEYRFDPDNGFTMCQEDHSDFHYKLMGGSRKKCTPKDMDRYIALYRSIYERAIAKD